MKPAKLCLIFSLTLSFLLPEFALAEDYPLPETLVDEEIHDPFEGVNRAIFWFNDKLDVYFLEPVARGYDKVLPDAARRGVENFFDNYNTPQYLFNDILQGKVDQFGNHLGRFMVNTSLGLGGFIDVGEKMGWEKHYEDLGTSLGYYGVNAGPYMMLPLLGPSTARETLSYVVDGAMDPLAIVTYSGALTDTEELVAGAIIYGVRAVDTRAGLLEAVETGKESSLDYYLFVQASYYQYRRNLIYDDKVPKFSDDEWQDEWEDDDWMEEESGEEEE